MTSSKPYLVRALYEWILDNDNTPYILVDTTNDSVSIPSGIASDGKVVLNLSPSAVKNLEMSNDHISFSARFNGVAEQIHVPVPALLAIYARENGEGMMFPVEGGAGDAESGDDSAKPKTPNLKVIK